MDISKTIAEMKKEPGFAAQVGMVLVHNGVVRAWSRKDRSAVIAIDVSVNRVKMNSLREEYSRKPGDDLLFIVVASDIREHVKPVLAELLDRVKAEAVIKTEHSE